MFILYAYHTDPCECSAWGDPHFTTCDGFDFNYQGKCKYTTAKACGDEWVNTEATPYFEITETHQPYEKNPKAATTKKLKLIIDVNQDGKADVVSCISKTEVK